MRTYKKAFKKKLALFMEWILLKLGLRNKCYKCGSKLIEHYHPEPITDRDYVYRCLKGCFLLLFLLLVLNNVNASHGQYNVTVIETNGISRPYWIVSTVLPFAKSDVSNLDRIVVKEGNTELRSSLKAIGWYNDNSYRFVLANFEIDLTPNQRKYLNVSYGIGATHTNMTGITLMNDADKKVDECGCIKLDTGSIKLFIEKANKTVHQMESTSNWTGVGTVLIQRNNASFKEGSNSLNINFVDNGGDGVRWANGLGRRDWSNYRYITFWIISNVSDADQFRLDIRSDSAGRQVYSTGTSSANTWQYKIIDLNSPTTIVKALNWTDITDLQLTENNAASPINISVDNIKLFGGNKIIKNLTFDANKNNIYDPTESIINSSAFFGVKYQSNTRRHPNGVSIWRNLSLEDFKIEENNTLRTILKLRLYNISANAISDLYLTFYNNYSIIDFYSSDWNNFSLTNSTAKSNNLNRLKLFTHKRINFNNITFTHSSNQSRRINSSSFYVFTEPNETLSDISWMNGTNTQNVNFMGIISFSNSSIYLSIIEPDIDRINRGIIGIINNSLRTMNATHIEIYPSYYGDYLYKFAGSINHFSISLAINYTESFKNKQRLEKPVAVFAPNTKWDKTNAFIDLINENLTIYDKVLPFIESFVSTPLSLVTGYNSYTTISTFLSEIVDGLLMQAFRESNYTMIEEAKDYSQDIIGYHSFRYAPIDVNGMCRGGDSGEHIKASAHDCSWDAYTQLYLLNGNPIYKDAGDRLIKGYNNSIDPLSGLFRLSDGADGNWDDDHSINGAHGIRSTDRINKGVTELLKYELFFNDSQYSSGRRLLLTTILAKQNKTGGIGGIGSKNSHSGFWYFIRHTVTSFDGAEAYKVTEWTQSYLTLSLSEYTNISKNVSIDKALINNSIWMLYELKPTGSAGYSENRSKISDRWQELSQPVGVPLRLTKAFIFVYQNTSNKTYQKMINNTALITLINIRYINANNWQFYTDPENNANSDNRANLEILRRWSQIDNHTGTWYNGIKNIFPNTITQNITKPSMTSMLSNGTDGKLRIFVINWRTTKAINLSSFNRTLDWYNIKNHTICSENKLECQVRLVNNTMFEFRLVNIDGYNMTEGQRYAEMKGLPLQIVDSTVPVYFTSSSTSTLKKIASNLSQAINATVRMNVAHTNIKDIVFINNDSRDYSPETWNFVGGQAEFTLNNIAPNSNTIYIDYGTQPLGQQQTIKGRGILRYITEELPINAFGSQYSLPAWVVGIGIISLGILALGLFTPISFPLVLILIVVNALLIWVTLS